MAVVGSVGVLLASVLTATPAAATARTTKCVGHRAGCFPTLAGALNAAHGGDTIRLLRGTFRGGVTVDKAVHLIGAGPGRSIIRGGGPVLTITRGATVRHHVTISGVTVTGGVTRRDGGEGFVALGGGIYIPTGPHGERGAIVSLQHVVVSGNRTAPTTTSSSPSGVKCPQGDCPFALTRGAGIASWGTLSLSHVTVRGNLAGGRASDGDGGGISSELGRLTIDHSAVLGNRVRPRSIGRFAEGGGLFVGSGALTLRHSVIGGNRADLVTHWPIQGQGVLLDMNANSGGVHVGDHVPTLVTDSRIVRNGVSAVDSIGEPVAFDSAMLVGNSRLVMRRTTIAHNTVVARTATSDDVGPSGTVLELDGPGVITRSHISDNPVQSFSRDGSAAATAGLAVYDFSNDPRPVVVSRTTIQHNTATSHSVHGASSSTGGGVFNNSLLTLQRVTVSGNRAGAFGPHATAQGAGLWNGVFLSGPPVQLRLLRTRVVGNRLAVSHGGTRRGAGLFTTVAVTRRHTVIRHNRPDQCSGCSLTNRSSAPGSSRVLPHAARRSR